MEPYHEAEIPTALPQSRELNRAERQHGSELRRERCARTLSGRLSSNTPKSFFCIACELVFQLRGRPPHPT